MRKIRAVLLLAAAAIGWMSRGWTDKNAAAPVSYHTGVSIQQLQTLSSLVTLRVDVADVVETRLSGYIGGVRAVVIVKGDFLLGTDLSRAHFEAVDPVTHHAVLVLPQPQVYSPRLDHERTRLFGVSESGLWQITPGGRDTDMAVITLAYRDAQRYVSAAAGDSTLPAKARQQAESVLPVFFRAMGWGVEIRWDGS